MDYGPQPPPPPPTRLEVDVAASTWSFTQQAPEDRAHRLAEEKLQSAYARSRDGWVLTFVLALITLAGIASVHQSIWGAGEAQKWGVAISTLLATNAFSYVAGKSSATGDKG